MGRDTNIEWCDSSVNGSSGCDGCELWNERKHTCYAGIVHTTRLALSYPHLYAKNFRTVQMIPGRFAKAAAWSDLRGVDRPEKPWLNGFPRCIFVGDMGDFLSSAVTDEFLESELLGAITSPKGQRHLWMLLTKRPWRLAALSEKWGGLPDNVIAMTTVTSQKTAEKRVPHLLKVKAKWLGLSCEPLLGPVDLRSLAPINPNAPCTTNALTGTTYWPDNDEEDGRRIDWIICGGESGTGAEPMNPDWARSLRNQCQSAGVPFFFKQHGEFVRDADITHEVMKKREVHSQIVLFGDGDAANFRRVYRVGKKDAGRLLDGREWNEMPKLGA